MKKTITFVAIILVLLLALATVLSCSGANKSVATYPEVTMQKFNDTCESPDEVHTVPPFRFPIPAQVIRHKNCLGVDDLLVVVWPGDLNEKNLTAVKLLVLMYIEHQDEEYTYTLLKTDRETLPEGLVVNMTFHKLQKIVKKQKN